MLNLNVQIHQYLFWNQLICTVTADCASQLDWPWKTTPKWPFECQNPSTGSKDTVLFILKSADLYSCSWFDLTFGFALKNYPKMTLWMSKSVHWIKRYSDNYFGVSWFIQSQPMWSYDWIGHEKLPQKDPLNVQIHSLDQKLLMCYVYFCIYIASIRPIGLVSTMWKVIITKN